MSKQRQKYPLLFSLVLCMTLLLCSCGEDDNYYFKEQEIIAFVQEHEEELRIKAMKRRRFRAYAEKEDLQIIFKEFQSKLGVYSVCLLFWQQEP